MTPAWDDDADEASARLAHAFAADGLLAKAGGYTVRDAQWAMAQAVAEALATRTALVAEAGTGIGKTYAYLIPLLMSGRRALVSTATKSLQDQLFQRDLPKLCALLGLPVRLALLKGRASYLCVHRLQEARQSAPLPDRYAVRAMARVELWAQGTNSGDLAELEGLDERSPVIPWVTSTRDNCLGAECPRFRDCHVMKARREALAADLVVVNHHMFFADLTLRDSGVAELLPSVDAIVFDEAHQLVEAGVQFLGAQLGSAQLLEFGRDLLALGGAHARGLQDWAGVAGACEAAARQLRLAATGSATPRVSLKLGWQERAQQADFEQALTAVAESMQGAAQAMVAVEGASPDLDRLGERATTLAARALAFAQPCAADHVRWIDLSPQQVRLIESPLDIAQALTQQRKGAPKTWIFTSATLGDDDALSWFVEPAGLGDARALRLGSPFDYPAHARLWIPERFPRPNDGGHPAAVAELAARLAQTLGGRTFVLTTTLRALRTIADALRDHFSAANADIQVLVQGSSPKHILLQQFLARPESVLVGSQSFWEGIDVPGDALQCVLIDKLPFPPPDDPLVQARVKRLEAQGKNAFASYFLAETAVSLKQGAGRLIRSEVDRGLLVVCDPRLALMSYGKRLRAALPPMLRLASEGDAVAWLNELAAAR